jgi:hypothetical protein
MIQSSGLLDDESVNEYKTRNFQEIEQLPDNQHELFAEFERRKRVKFNK